MVKRTQILSTIGPSSERKLRKMYQAGMSGIRINSSHGNMEQHERIINNVRKINKRIFVVYDIKGPKIRLGDIPHPIHLKSGMEIILKTTKKKQKDGYPVATNIEFGIPVTFDDLHKYIKIGHHLLLDDGLIGLKVNKVTGRKIICSVIYGDIMRSRKGINHPDTVISFPYTVEADISRIEFAIKNKVDYIADSFVRDGDDVDELRERLKGTGIKIISKIENPEGIENFDDILEKTDSIMIARGDLGVELEPWEIPELQKTIIEKCNKQKKPVITATQMLESMIDDPRPKRSDVSDIANAIYDGTDVIMLSGETSTGNYPVKCVEMMKKIIDKTEATKRYGKKTRSFL